MSEKSKVLILDDWEGRLQRSNAWQKIEHLVEVEAATDRIQPDAVRQFGGVEYLIPIRERTKIDSVFLGLFPNLKVIFQTGGHAYHIDFEAAKQRGVRVVLGRQVKAPMDSVPELTIGMMLIASHKMWQAQEAMASGEWPLLLGRTLRNRNLGILGLGRHGLRVAEIAKTAFGMNVFAWQRSKETDSTGIPRLPLDELLSGADIVSVHLKLSAESKGLLDERRLQQMKHGSILINTSRGSIIDESALIIQLEKQHIAAAGLDVFGTEPLAPDSKLRRLPNVILTPHIGYTVEEVFDEFAEIAADQIFRYLKGDLNSAEYVT